MGIMKVKNACVVVVFPLLNVIAISSVLFACAVAGRIQAL
jgi:hypothetical protein